MANMLDYIDWRGDLTFDEAPFCEVDSLILSQICYVDFEGIVSPSLKETTTLSAAAKGYLRRHAGEKAYLGAIVPKEIILLMSRAASSKRFSKIEMCGHVNLVLDDVEMQFSATTFIVKKGMVFVAFRGTDDTLVGWKENFNMSFMHPVPAQTESVAYLESVIASRKEKEVIVGGHSKGGNLAVYAFTKASKKTKARVKEAYNHDGPGFSREFIESPDYDEVRSRIRTILPQTAVVGMLLEHEERYDVIKSNQTGLFQHDSFSWEVLGPNFIHLDTVTKESKLIDKTIREWLSTMPAEERESFVENLYASLSAQGAKTLTDLSSDKAKIIKVWSGLDAASRSTALKYIKLLFTETAKDILKKKDSANKNTLAKKSPHPKT